MASDPPLARIGATFRLLMQVRVLAAGLALLLVPEDSHSLATLSVLSCVGALSALALFGWREIVPRLLGHPVLLALDALVVYATLELGGVLGPFFLVTTLTSTLAGLLFQWPGTLLICPLQVLLYYAAAAEDAWVVSFQTVLGMPACYFIGGFVGTALRRLFDESARSEEARHRAEVAAAAAEERARLAREMHDSLAKTLRGISMAAAALPAWVSRCPERAGEEARRIVAAAETASREARELIAELRTDTARRPLGEVVEEIADRWAATSGVRAEVSADPGIELPVRARHEIAAILKEALENVQRHAAAASVDVRLRRDGDTAVLIVADHGKGFAMPTEIGELARAGHYGVIGMQERAAHVGAELTVESKTGAGTTVTVTVPIPAGAEAPAPQLEVA